MTFNRRKARCQTKPFGKLELLRSVWNRAISAHYFGSIYAEFGGKLITAQHINKVFCIHEKAEITLNGTLCKRLGCCLHDCNFIGTFCDGMNIRGCTADINNGKVADIVV